MKSLLPLVIGGNGNARVRDTLATALIERAHGSVRTPEPPRDVFFQPGARKGLLTWKLPVSHNTISGWRVYRDTEDNLAIEIRDKAARQTYIDMSAGATRPVTNFFVSAVTGSSESQKIQVQGQALDEPTAPVDPNPPPEFPDEGAGGGNREPGGVGRIRATL